MASCFSSSSLRTLPRQFSSKSCLPFSRKGFKPAATQLSVGFFFNVFFFFLQFACAFHIASLFHFEQTSNVTHIHTDIRLRSLYSQCPHSLLLLIYDLKKISLACLLSGLKLRLYSVRMLPLWGCRSLEGFFFFLSRQQHVSCLNSWAVSHSWLLPIVGQLESFIGLPSFTQTVAVT